MSESDVEGCARSVVVLLGLLLLIGANVWVWQEVIG